MLLSLSVKNYALIEDLNIDFSSGFTAITGETGAGKSILIKAIELLTGARADPSMVRRGYSICTITASFEHKNQKIADFLNDFSIPKQENNAVLIRRTIENLGKSKAFINDSQISVSSLTTFGKLLVDFYGQDEKYSLVNPEYQLEILDNEIKNIKLFVKKLSDLHVKVKNLKIKLNTMNLSDTEKEHKIDLYSFQTKEIEDAKLEPGEDKKLENELSKLKEAEKIIFLSQEVVSKLYSSQNSALDVILKIKRDIELINSYGADASEALSLIEQAYCQTEETYREVNNILSNTSLDPEKLNVCLERIELIKKLKKKYGTSIEAIVEYKNKILGELNSIKNYKNASEKIKKELEKESNYLSAVCKTISQKRQKMAQILAKSVQRKLFELEIKNAVFKIKFYTKKPSYSGCDTVEFVFSANKGEKILPLKNVASGGELSRVLLAIELSLKTKDCKTTIFDEIDTGTGGKTGEKIGRKLFELAKSKQIFSITHLAQIAAFAGTHIKIYKEIKNSRTYTKAKTLNEEERIAEIARMISGEKITESALEHAKTLIINSLKIQ